MAEIKKNEAITSRSVDFAQWYTDVCRKAELMDYSDLKGFIIYRPYGYALWEQIQQYLDREFKKTDHQNVYMPSLIPESLFTKEKEHVEGFAPECAIVTIGGKKELEERLYIRPTSEVLFCQHFQKVLSSYRDLPLLYNQWCNVIRWEKTTRPFLRGSEFLWQEGHTIHETEIEARGEVMKMLNIYASMGQELLAFPFTTGRKTEKEKFAGALETYTIEALMPDGQALQSGTTHYFGTGFCEKFNIKFQGRDNKISFPHQTSWGVSTRLLGALIMVHGDDNGLVLPPYVAPTQIVIIPIAPQKPGVLTKSKELFDEIKKAGFRVKLDDSDRSAGWKHAEYEMKGVPVRIEIGPRDLENNECVVCTRYDSLKTNYRLEEIVAALPHLLTSINEGMYNKALRYLLAHTTTVKTYAELEDVIVSGKGYAKMMWCEDVACENLIKEKLNATSRCMPFNQDAFSDVCPICGKKATKVILFARAY